MKKSKKVSPVLTVDSKIASFYYKGSHSHPVKRVVLLDEEASDGQHLAGFELVDGKEVRGLAEAPFRRYSLKKVASPHSLRTDSLMAWNYGNDTTLSIRTLGTRLLDMVNAPLFS